MEEYEEQITEGEKRYEALVGEKEREEGQLHHDIKELYRQLAEKASPEKKSRPKASPAPTESGYESTGSVITVINTKHSYAEVVGRKGKDKEKKKEGPTEGLLGHRGGTTPGPLPLQRPPNRTPPMLKRAQAVVMDAAPLRYKPGTMRQRIEEHNRGVEIIGNRWLTKEHLPGRVAPSLVIYMKSAVEISRLSIGRKTYYTERYDWGRGRT